MKKRELLDLVLKIYFKFLKDTAKSYITGEINEEDNEEDNEENNEEQQLDGQDIETGLDNLLGSVGIDVSQISPEKLQEYEEEIIEELKDDIINKILKVESKTDEDFRKVIDEVINQYNEAVAVVIGVPIYEILRGSFIHPDNVPYLLSQVEISQRLWRHGNELKAKLLKLLNDKIAAKATIREIKDVLFRGYNSPDDILPLIDELPGYLKEAIQTGQAGKKVQQLIDNIQTAPLRTAYRQLVELLNKEADKAFKKALYTALNEKTRFYALRIAETETYRAVNFAQFRDFMADDEVQFVRYRLSSLHKKKDICDFYANLDIGYGRGIYPKKEARVVPLHPFCRCGYEPVYRVKKYEPKTFIEAEQEYLSRLKDRDLHEILGTWKNVDLWKQGLSAETIFNMNRPDYKIVKFSDVLNETIAKLTYDKMKYEKEMSKYKIYKLENALKRKNILALKTLKESNNKKLYNLLNKLQKAK